MNALPQSITILSPMDSQYLARAFYLGNTVRFETCRTLHANGADTVVLKAVVFPRAWRKTPHR